MSTAVGIVIYYIVICLYLYGDLAIYLVAIPKSIVTVVWYVNAIYIFLASSLPPPHHPTHKKKLPYRCLVRTYANSSTSTAPGRFLALQLLCPKLCIRAHIKVPNLYR